jgi:hypothetical protein
VTDTAPQVDPELSEEELDLDSSAEDVEVSEVETTGSTEVDAQDPEALAVGDDA